MKKSFKFKAVTAVVAFGISLGGLGSGYDTTINASIIDNTPGYFGAGSNLLKNKLKENGKEPAGKATLTLGRIYGPGLPEEGVLADSSDLSLIENGKYELEVDFNIVKGVFNSEDIDVKVNDTSVKENLSRPDKERLHIHNHLVTDSTKIEKIRVPFTASENPVNKLKVSINAKKGLIKKEVEPSATIRYFSYPKKASMNGEGDISIKPIGPNNDNKKDDKKDDGKKDDNKKDDNKDDSKKDDSKKDDNKKDDKKDDGKKDDSKKNDNKDDGKKDDNNDNNRPTPDVVPDVTPDVVPDITPDVVPDITPDVPTIPVGEDETPLGIAPVEPSETVTNEVPKVSEEPKIIEKPESLEESTDNDTDNSENAEDVEDTDNNELDIDDDETPQGATKIAEEPKITTEDDKTPLAGGLAKTGGLHSNFFLASGILSLLIAALAILEKFRK